MKSSVLYTGSCNFYLAIRIRDEVLVSLKEEFTTFLGKVNYRTLIIRENGRETLKNFLGKTFSREQVSTQQFQVATMSSLGPQQPRKGTGCLLCDFGLILGCMVDELKGSGFSLLPLTYFKISKVIMAPWVSRSKISNYVLVLN